MMFGIPGAALAMIQSAKTAIRRKLQSDLSHLQQFPHSFVVLQSHSSSHSCSSLRHFTLIYALLYGIFTVITVALGFRAGFSFSAGTYRPYHSHASLPAAAKTWLIIPLGIAAFIVFYVVFRFAIVKFDLKTPGREDDDDDEDKKLVLANDDFTTVAKICS